MCITTLVGSIHSNSLVFQRSGTIATDVTAIILVGEIDIEPLISQLQNISHIDEYLQDIWKSVTPKASRIETKYLASQIRLIREQVTTAQGIIEDIAAVSGNSRHPSTTDSSRESRSVLLIAGLAAIGASLSNLFYSRLLASNIDRLREDNDHLFHGVQILTRRTQENSRKILSLEKAVLSLAKQQLVTEHAIDDERHLRESMMEIDGTYRSLVAYTQSLHDILTTLTQALQGKVDTHLINPTQVQTELQKIKSRIPDDMKIAISKDHIMDFYSLPCHTQMEKSLVRVIIPIPIFNILETLEMYRYIPTPLLVQHGIELFLTGKDHVLATNNENTLYLDLAESEIQACLNVGTLHLCPAMRVQKKEDIPSCLHLLFRGLTKEALGQCQHKVRLLQSLELTLVQPDTVLATASESRQLQQECEDKTQSRILSIDPGQTSLRIPNGCSLATKEYYVSPLRNSTVFPLETTLRIPHAPTLDLQAILDLRYEQRNTSLRLNPTDIVEMLQRTSSSNDPVDLDYLSPPSRIGTEHGRPTSNYWGWLFGICSALIVMVPVTFIQHWCYRHSSQRSGRAFQRKGLCSGTDAEPSIHLYEVTSQ